MIIKVDEDGKKAISTVCDVLARFAGDQLRGGGLVTCKNSETILASVGKVVDAMKLIRKKKPTSTKGN